MNRKRQIASLAILSLLFICICALGCGALVWRASQFSPLPPSANATAPALGRMVTPAGTTTRATADALQRAQIPARDLYQIVPRLRKDFTPVPMPTPAPRAYPVGARESFYVIEDASSGKYRLANATLRVVSQYGLFWVEEGLRYDPAALQKSAEFFDRSVYPTNVKYFGEVPPGLDGEARIHILNTRFEDAAGYFSSEDTYPRALAPYSNQRNVIYMNIEVLQPGGDEYNGDLAHEFQHLIHHYQARFKTGWVDEGMADLAIRLNGLPVGGVLGVFARNPDTQLNTWADDPQESYAHYAASYLFFAYAAERFGSEFTRAVIHAPHEGVKGVQAALDERANGMRFEDLFAEWAVTNYLNDPAVGDGRYAYRHEGSFRIARAPSLSDYPMTRAVQTHQYTASYAVLQPTVGDVTLYFTGTTTAKLIAADAHSGRWVWYSNRADLSDMTLTRAFDLTRAQDHVTLQFWTWYDIEADFDYAYVEVSTDGGKTWDILPGTRTVTTNPNGANYGHAFTGHSGVAGKAPAQWVQEQMDLSAYAGKQIYLRFEYITDDAYNAPGWAIDDIAIPEIGYHDDIESGEGGWGAAGFIRSDNVLPQTYVVQLIEQGTTTRIVRVPLDAQNRGAYTLNGFGKDVLRAVLVVTPFAPTTTETTEYQVGVARR